MMVSTAPVFTKHYVIYRHFDGPERYVWQAHGPFGSEFGYAMSLAVAEVRAKRAAGLDS
jgi:hypothetical protein